MLYFAYGSNLSLPRLHRRCPEALPLGRAHLADHRLTFDKVGQDGSGKCDCPPCPNGRLWGALYRMDSAALGRLDVIEGEDYRRIEREVVLEGEGRVLAWCYQARVTQAGLAPFPWYRTHVLLGARQLGLPGAYLAQLAAVPCQPDPDWQRQHRELAIYRDARTPSPGADAASR
ncbi:gamma-glutamylcyclotransferase family protein [Ferrimonas balearica]|uniref:gamma-glutamylcyclotransferase family protein n=1 Tax=Ferrimonas balearica TaxID=44012 RepID=UPI001C9973A9|nr:gamma-glutamylcyclotransferase family protein [Ferrimonas balearica]MBY5991927.1 gamma-glutamylcyclotransferase [Ferrimonas balearica]